MAKDDRHQSQPEPAEPGVGLCSVCRHARRTSNRRGSTFWQCLKAEKDARFRRYPELAVERCSRFERG